jgi:hydrogenase nickel incorporation protein HypA/HybF
MHELSVTENLLEIALRHAEVAKARRVTDLYLRIGQLSSFVDDSIQFYWDIISKGTICEGAVLHFERIPAELQCLDCGALYNLDSEMLPCPQCGSSRVKVLRGDELKVDSIAVDT